MALDHDDVLACGRDLQTVWDSIGEPPDEHQRNCPTCIDARASVERVQLAATQIREFDRTDASMRPPMTLVESIMNIARSEVRRGRSVVLVHDIAGDVSASEAALAQSVREAVDAVGGVRAQRVSFEENPEGMQVRVKLAMALGNRATEVSEQVQAAVHRLLGRQLDRPVLGVDVDVEDVYEQ